MQTNAMEWNLMLCRSMLAKDGEHSLEFVSCEGTTDTYQCKHCREFVEQFTDGCGG